MRQSTDDSFAILGTHSTATKAEVKKAYRRLVAKWHPDRFAMDPEKHRLAQERLKEINAAYADCLKLISRTSAGIKDAPVAAPPRKTAKSAAPSAAAVRSKKTISRFAEPPLAMWPNLSFGALLAAGWLVALQRYGFGLEFLKFVGMLATLPLIAAFWYNARLLTGRLMLFLYLLAVGGAGLFLVVNQALYEQQLLAAVPSWQGSGVEASRGVNAAGRAADTGGYSIFPPTAGNRAFGPTAPVVPVPAAPMAPESPLMPAAPASPRTR